MDNMKNGTNMEAFYLCSFYFKKSLTKFNYEDIFNVNIWKIANEK